MKTLIQIRCGPDESQLSRVTTATPRRGATKNIFD
jgi:hypothetical protein